MRFPEAIAHMRAGGTINASVLHYLGFASQPMRVWHGAGELVTPDGYRWQGIGDVVSIEGGGQQLGVVATNLTLTMAASSDLMTDDMIARALESEAEVYGRRYFMAIQFFNEHWQPVDAYRAVYVGVMDRMTFKRSPGLRQITLNIESPFVRRRTPRLQTFSDRDQKSRFANDKGLEFISSLKDKTVIWPKF
jgi:hypothetical protein